MTKPNDGGPAFPVHRRERNGRHSTVSVTYSGMSKREEYAKAALQGILSNPEAITSVTVASVERGIKGGMAEAKAAFAWADAMLAASEADNG